MADSEVGGGRHRVGGRPPDHAAADVYALLGNETRLAVLLALWEVQVPLADDNAVPFSEIFERVPIDDRGNLSYHLDQLEDRFITQHEDRGGYELLIPGLKLVRTIVAGTGVQETTVEPTPIEQPCPLCGGGTRISYRQGVVFLECVDCAGMAPGKAEIDGVLNAVYVEPAGVAERTPEELFTASVAATLGRARSFFDGVCPTCTGPIDSWLEVCPDHDAAGGCADCGLREPVVAQSHCRICKDFGGGTLKRLALFHPAVVSFYADHGVSTRVHADDHEAARRVYDRLYAHEVEPLSAEPPRGAVTASLDGDAVRLTFDATVTVVDVDR